MTEGDPGSKRRFSLRLSNGEDDQKRMRAEHGHALRSKEALPMREHGDHGDRSYQPPSTSASSRFERSTSDESNSSSGGAPSHKNAWLPHSHAAAPSWRGRDTQYHLPSPSHPYQTSTSASTRMPSHPGFALSSGQPLVKPPAKTQAAFVGKLYSMLENEEILRTGLIRWSAGGTMITCPNPTEFAKTVLPRFFKHNNWQSFVRQLNMYSFNKVNDLYTTTSEPQAWEFRHPLFRQGEPHLLASIKRKSTRNNNNNNKINNASDPQSATDEEGKGGLAGWMRSGSIVASSPRESDRHRPDVYGMNVQTGEMATARTTDDVRREFWDGSIHPGGTRTAQQLYTGSAAIEQITNKFHPDPSRPPLSGHRFAPSGGFPESPLYPSPPQHWPIEATGAHIAALEGNLQRVSYTLQHERVERARADIDLVAYVGQIVGWISSGHPPNGVELHVLQDTLQRTSAELMARYEELAAGVVIPAPGVVQHPVPTEQQHHTPILNAAIQYGPSRPMSSRSAAHTAPPPLNRMPSHYTPRSSPLPSSTLTDPFMRAFGSPRAATIPGEMPPPRRAPPTPHASVATIPPPNPSVKTDTEATAPAIASAPTSAPVPTAGSGSESAPATAPASAATSDDPASRERAPGLRNLLN